MQDGDQSVKVRAEESSATTIPVAVRKKPAKSAKATAKSGQKARTTAAVAAAAPSAPHAARHHRLRKKLFVALPVLGVVLLVWLAGNLYLTRYRLGAGSVVAHASDAQLAQLVEQQAATYQLKVTDMHGAAALYSLKDLGMQADATASVAAAHHQRDSWHHRLAWWRPVPVTLSTKVNIATFNAFIAKHITRTIRPARSAAISLHGGAVHLTAGTSGEAYGLDNPTTTILTAVERLQTTPLRLHEVAQAPPVTQTALMGVEANIRHMLQQRVVVQIGSHTTTARPSDIAAWLRLTPKPHGKTVAVTVNQGAVQAYLNALAAAYVHPPRAQVAIAGGTTIPGERGVTVGNIPGATAAISHAVLVAQGTHATLPVQYTPFQTINAASYSKWFEVDLTNHRMYAYQHTSLVRTFLVSAGKVSTPTVTGDYAIYSKFTSQTMTGADYVQPNVPWVNYFYKDFAIHGNYWSPASYFGNFNASHGCVGVQVADAAWIYTWAPVGTHVVVHT